MESDLADKVEGAGEGVKKKAADVKDSLLEGKDDFFEKAKRFAEGDYRNEGKKTGDMKMEKNPDYKPKKDGGKATGFDDLDGDGDEIIDDAIIEE
jgi:hypothetical protein